MLNSIQSAPHVPDDSMDVVMEVVLFNNFCMTLMILWMKRKRISEQKLLEKIKVLAAKPV